jgi:hypothetical protein
MSIKRTIFEVNYQVRIQKNPNNRADGQQAAAYPNTQKGEMDHEEKCG